MIIQARSPEHRAMLVEWMARKTGKQAIDLVGPFHFEVLGVIKDGKLMGAVLFTQFRSGDAEVTCVGEPGWLSRGVVKGFVQFGFGTLGLRRMTAIVHRKHRLSRRLAEGLGFKMEGVKPSAMDDGGTAIHYGMLAQTCRWI